ncbi:MAG: GTP diphosphokinase [Gammaproteobacteria bacterium]
MVKKVRHYHHESGYIDSTAWLAHLNTKRKPHEIDLIRRALTLAELSGAHQATLTGESCLQQGLAIADILEELDLDIDTIAAAIVYPAVHYADLHLEDISEQLNKTIARLVDGVSQMEAIRNLHLQQLHRHNQIDKFRKMLLAMVEDVRVVLMKLAERTFIIRAASILPKAKQQEIAQEIKDIYAPLANRLGIGQIKWELEDFAFRYLESDIYKDIAKQVDQKRHERETYIKNIIIELEAALKKEDIQTFEVSGRAKHIYSIYGKMTRKKVDFSQIYDVLAVRVLVNTVEDCYKVLAIAHALWKSIPEEFDDYITNPKPNGYRSLHTAVLGPQSRNLEIQIRTFTMHQESELGIAAHWVYKEGASSRSAYDQKIAWLRQVIDWQKELAKSDETTEIPETKIFEDRVYVFTPNSEIIDLPQGATPLDFAYLIHTQIGHRCKGAKINGNIVPLTYQLKTGDRVEILTSKNPNPSRDWLNPNLHYLISSRAKAKVLHWFKLQDYDKNRHDGHEIFARELKRLGLDNIRVEQLSEHFSQKTTEDFYAAIGAGDIRISQIIGAIELLHRTEQAQKPTETVLPIKREVSHKIPKGITIEGVGNLLTSIAKCCHPLPGDEIVGYITQGKGVMIHKQDCLNVSNIDEKQKERLLEVTWGEERAFYPVDIDVTAYERPGLVRDITGLLAQDKINLLSLTTNADKQEHSVAIHATIEIEDLSSLSRILDRINQIPNISSAKRSNV